ncbi:MAG TPA: polysaccharide deacetylase family protein [Candidatus Limnocylindrales bacterium]|nr:polysaccharide deacetylase family protein [Candidatus Limnocylindrales bacterium]
MGGRLVPALQIVDWLIGHGIPATIFPTGDAASTTTGRAVLARVAAHPELFAIGNHSWSHPDFRTLSAPAIADQLDRTEAYVRGQTGRTTRPFFRPPYGGQNLAVRTATGAAGWAYTVMWEVDTIDSKPIKDGGPTAAQMIAKIDANATAGSIVLMHLGGYETYDALPAIVEGLAANGLTPVTLSTLLDTSRG